LKEHQYNLTGEDTRGPVIAIQRAGTCWNSSGPEGHNEVVNVSIISEKETNFKPEI